MKPSDNFRIAVFGYSCHSGIYDEISLWHRVRYFDIRQDILYTRYSHLNVPKTKLIPLIVDYLFDEELAEKVIFIKSGYLFTPELFAMNDIITNEFRIITKSQNSHKPFKLHEFESHGEHGEHESHDEHNDHKDHGSHNSHKAHDSYSAHESHSSHKTRDSHNSHMAHQSHDYESHMAQEALKTQERHNLHYLHDSHEPHKVQELHNSHTPNQTHEYNNFSGTSQILPKVDDESRWSCSIKIRKKLIYTPLTIHKPNTTVTDSVALLIPSKNGSGDLEDCALVKYFIPSFLRTCQDSKIKVVFYIGYDTGDPLLHNAKNRERLRGLLPNYKVVFIELPRSGWLTFIWNYLFVRAYIDGNSYFVQLNDDLEFLKPNWLESSISLLNQTSGVIGFNDVKYDCKLFTQTLVNRNHFKIFDGHFFPLELPNWYSDNWITYVYSDGGKCNTDALISNGHVRTRYSKCDDRNFLRALEEGRIKHMNFSSLNN